MAKKKEFYFRSFLMGQLKRLYRRYPPYYETLNANKVVYYVDSKKGKKLKRVKLECSSCHEFFKQKEVNIDHIIPVIPEAGFPLNPDGSDDWNAYIPRLFCPKENLQRICKGCHNVKSKSENTNRRAIKRRNRKRRKSIHKQT